MWTWKCVFYFTFYVWKLGLANWLMSTQYLEAVKSTLSLLYSPVSLRGRHMLNTPDHSKPSWYLCSAVTQWSRLNPGASIIEMPSRYKVPQCRARSIFKGDDRRVKQSLSLTHSHATASITSVSAKNQRFQLCVLLQTHENVLNRTVINEPCSVL